jgi:hypothetical protein
MFSKTKRLKTKIDKIIILDLLKIQNQNVIKYSKEFSLKSEAEFTFPFNFHRILGQNLNI